MWYTVVRLLRGYGWMWSAVVKSVHVCLVVWLGKEVCCSSSRAHGSWFAGAMCRSRTTRCWQELGAEDGDHVCVREAQYALWRPAHAQQRSVWWRAGRVYGCGVLARGQKTMYTDAGRVHGEYVHVDRELSTQIQSRGSLKRGS